MKKKPRTKFMWCWYGYKPRLKWKRIKNKKGYFNWINSKYIIERGDDDVYRLYSNIEGDNSYKFFGEFIFNQLKNAKLVAEMMVFG